MKYIANPVEVQAYKIIDIRPTGDRDSFDLLLTLEDHHIVIADAAMLARATPQLGDYWVVQSVVYIMPKESFRRNFCPA